MGILITGGYDTGTNAIPKEDIDDLIDEVDHLINDDLKTDSARDA